jgi:ferritin-like metal-binding protein YciE
MAALRSADDILQAELKEIYSAERQLARALPKLMKQVSSDRVRQMLDQRREQAANLIEQLDEAFDEMNISKGRHKNVAAEGLIEDANQHIEQIEDERFLDPLLIAAMQKIEHYCIAAWGTVASMGRLLEEDKIIQTMERVLEEGRRFDQEMTRIAEEEVNPKMLDDEDEDFEDEDVEDEDDKEEGEGQQNRQQDKGKEGATGQRGKRETSSGGGNGGRKKAR